MQSILRCGYRGNAIFRGSQQLEHSWKWLLQLFLEFISAGTAATVVMVLDNLFAVCCCLWSGEWCDSQCVSKVRCHQEDLSWRHSLRALYSLVSTLNRRYRLVSIQALCGHLPAVCQRARALVFVISAAAYLLGVGWCQPLGSGWYGSVVLPRLKCEFPKSWCPFCEPI